MIFVLFPILAVGVSMTAFFVLLNGIHLPNWRRIEPVYVHPLDD